MTVSTKGVGTNYWDESYIIQLSFRANLNKIQHTHTSNFNYIAPGRDINEQIPHCLHFQDQL